MADPTQSDARAARLAAALRANLARRKARDRGERLAEKTVGTTDDQAAR